MVVSPVRVLTEDLIPWPVALENFYSGAIVAVAVAERINQQWISARVLNVYLGLRRMILIRKGLLQRHSFL